MGLDISYASKINFESRSYISDDIDMDGIPNGVYLYPNDSLLDQSEGIQSGEYACEGVQDSFRAGSYSGYSNWRRTLAKMIGWDIEDLWRNVETLVQRNENLNDVLNENDRLSVDIPFVELIHFSDCEGFIGPKTSTKLYLDFLEWDEKAKTVDPFVANDCGYFYETYQRWTEAFKVASDGGCVVFC
jgi:hypothetical protein